MGDTPLHPPHSQSRPLRKAAGPYPMAWVLLFTAAGVAVARYATLPAGFLAAAFAAATLMAFITYRRRIGNGYIAIALLLLGMALPALRPQPAYGPAGTNRLHEAAAQRIRRLHLPPDAEAVALAMAAGDQTELTPERRAPYARTGTAHVLAVSGLHVGMVFLYVNLLLGALALLHRGHLLRNAAAIAVIWLFAAAAGLSPGTIRAAVMFTALQLALATTSRYAGVNILSAAAFGMLLWRPSYLFHVGFQLSFLSVAAILLWGIPLYRRLRTPWRAANAAVGMLVVGAGAATAPPPRGYESVGETPPAGRGGHPPFGAPRSTGAGARGGGRPPPRWECAAAAQAPRRRRRRSYPTASGRSRSSDWRSIRPSSCSPTGWSGYRCCGWRSPGRPFRSSSVRCSKGCCGCKTGWSPKRPPCPVPRSTTG